MTFRVVTRDLNSPVDFLLQARDQLGQCTDLLFHVAGIEFEEIDFDIPRILIVLHHSR